MTGERWDRCPNQGPQIHSVNWAWSMATNMFEMQFRFAPRWVVVVGHAERRGMRWRIFLFVCLGCELMKCGLLVEQWVV
jgi:hypothetical protein